LEVKGKAVSIKESSTCSRGKKKGEIKGLILVHLLEGVKWNHSERRGAGNIAGEGLD